MKREFIVNGGGEIDPREFLIVKPNDDEEPVTANITELEKLLNDRGNWVMLNPNGLIVGNVNEDNINYPIILIPNDEYVSSISIESNANFLSLPLVVEHARVYFNACDFDDIESVGIEIKARHYNAAGQHEKRGTLNLKMDVGNADPDDPYNIRIMSIYRVVRMEK